MEIREATIDDIPELTELWKEFMDFHGRYDPFFTRAADGHERWAEFARANIENEDWLVLIALEGNQAVGYCMAAVLDYPPVMETKRHGLIQDVAVTGRCRRNGIGERMVRRTEAWIRARGVRRIELHVATTNEISRAFWRKMGFSEYVERLAKTL